MSTMEESEFELYQTTKVRIYQILEDGVEVKTSSNKLGFIPFCNLVENKYGLKIDQSLYVIFLGKDKDYLYFAEDSLFNPTPSSVSTSTPHLSGLEMFLMNYQSNIIGVIKLFLADQSVVEISSKLNMPKKEVLEIIEKFQSE